MNLIPSFSLRPAVATAGMNKADVLSALKFAIINQYAPEAQENDLIVISQAPPGRVLQNPITILFETKTPQQSANFIGFARFVESLELSLALKYRIRFVTKQKDFASIKIFNSVDEFANILGVEPTIETSAASAEELDKDKIDLQVKEIFDKNNVFVKMNWKGKELILTLGQKNEENKKLVSDLEDYQDMLEDDASKYSVNW